MSLDATTDAFLSYGISCPATFALGPSNNTAISSKVCKRKRKRQPQTRRIGNRAYDTYRTAGLHIEEIYHRALNDQDDNVHEVELPGQGLQTNGIDVLVEDAGETGEDEAERQAFGADVEGEDFDRVGDG